MATMFEKASRLKLRFETEFGMASVEDLWDLPLTTRSPQRVSLDQIAMKLHRELKEATDVVSFVNTTSGNNDELQLRFDLVKYVIDVKVRERDAAAVAHTRAETKQKLLEVLARKQDHALETMTVEEIQQRINEL